MSYSFDCLQGTKFEMRKRKMQNEIEIWIVSTDLEFLAKTAPRIPTIINHNPLHPSNQMPERMNQKNPPDLRRLNLLLN